MFRYFFLICLLMLPIACAASYSVQSQSELQPLERAYARESAEIAMGKARIREEWTAKLNEKERELQKKYTGKKLERKLRFWKSHYQYMMEMKLALYPEFYEEKRHRDLRKKIDRLKTRNPQSPYQQLSGN